MSSHPKTILGPYVFCKTHNEPSTEQQRTCSEPKCKQHGTSVHDNRTKFCDNCGSPIQVRAVPIEREKVNAYQVRETLHERLADVQGYSLTGSIPTHVWISNIRGASKREQSFYPDNSVQLIEVTPDLIAAELEEFKAFYAKELVLLQQQGYDLVELRWGLINYIN